MEAFSIGRVFSRAFGLIRDSFGSVGVFVFLVLLAETGIGLVAQPLMVESVQTAVSESTGQGNQAALAIFGTIWYWLVLLVSLVGMCLAWSGGMSGLLQQADTGQTSVAECFQRGLARFLPVLALITLWWLGVALGWVIFIVPATILVSMWAVALPAMIGEGLGVFAAFGRSRELTRGNRLSIFGVLVLLIVIYYALAIVIAGSVIGVGALSGVMSGDTIEAISPWLTVAALPVSWVSGMLLKAIVASLYLESVLVKEGVRTDRLTGVFD